MLVRELPIVIGGKAGCGDGPPKAGKVELSRAGMGREGEPPRR